jgi:hypothetical protein
MDLTHSSHVADAPMVALPTHNKIYKNVVLTSVPGEYNIFNVYALDTSVCKLSEQSEYYLQGFHKVLCLVCTNAVHIPCCLNKLKMEQKHTTYWHLDRI